MRSQIKLGKVFGIEIGLHYSWFLIALLIVSSLYSQFHLKNPEWGDGVILAMAIVTGLLFFLSLLVHELAHSVFARSHGLPVKEITLFALGGVSQIEKDIHFAVWQPIRMASSSVAALMRRRGNAAIKRRGSR